MTVIVVFVMVAACAVVGPPTNPGDAAMVTLPVAPAVTVVQGQATSMTGCRFGYSLYARGGASGPARVVLGHGFLRDRRRMHGLATALAAAGLNSVSLDFCNMGVFDGAHAANADDMLQIARDIGSDRIVYVGFSAGGLAALLAAARDPRAAGVFTLDLVDDAGLGERAAAGLGVPLRGLFGEPSRCNDWGAGADAFLRAPDADRESIAGATHCDFESPSDWLCELVCVSGEDAASHANARRDLIVRRSVRAILRLLNQYNPPPTDVN